MIKDVLKLLSHVVDLLHFTRGILGALLLALLLCSVLLALAEDLAYVEALYLTAITGLTIGYGDIAPVTDLGRIVSVVIGILGVIYVGIAVAIVNRALALARDGSKRGQPPRHGRDHR